MNAKLKVVLSLVAFLAVLGGLKIFYDRSVGNNPLDPRAQIPVTTAAQSATAGITPATAPGTLTATTAADTRETIAMPEATVYDAQGNTVQLSSFRGKKTIINAWASWCGPCKAEMPDFAELDREAGDDYQIVMINITSGLETRENADKFLADNDLEFTTMLYDEDMEFAQNLQIGSIPTTIFVDEAGQIHFYQPGMLTKSQVLDGLAQME